jgi:hypothetical protein
LSASPHASGREQRRLQRILGSAAIAVSSVLSSTAHAQTSMASVASMTGGTTASMGTPERQPGPEPEPDQAPTAAPAPQPDRPNDGAAPARRPRMGAIAGLGFPHPLSIEAMVKLDDYVAVGGEYGVLPTITIDQIQTHLWSLSADGRVFPFRNTFYVGLRVGRQHVGASGTVNVDTVGALNEQLALDSWFLNPRIGALWTAPSGLTIGAEIGIQIPVSPSVTSSLPLAYAPEAERRIDTLGKTVLPTIDLLQIGVLF